VLQVFLLAAFALFAAAAAVGEPDGEVAQQLGRSRVSDEQLNMALSDKRYLTRQLKCALGEAPCDPVGRRLKSTSQLQIDRAAWMAIILDGEPDSKRDPRILSPLLCPSTPKIHFYPSGSLRREERNGERRRRHVYWEHVGISLDISTRYFDETRC